MPKEESPVDSIITPPPVKKPTVIPRKRVPIQVTKKSEIENTPSHTSKDSLICPKCHKKTLEWLTFCNVYTCCNCSLYISAKELKAENEKIGTSKESKNKREKSKNEKLIDATTSSIKKPPATRLSIEKPITILKKRTSSIQKIEKREEEKKAEVHVCHKHHIRHEGVCPECAVELNRSGCFLPTEVPTSTIRSSSNKQQSTRSTHSGLLLTLLVVCISVGSIVGLNYVLTNAPNTSTATTNTPSISIPTTESLISTTRYPLDVVSLDKGIIHTTPNEFNIWFKIRLRTSTPGEKYTAYVYYQHPMVKEKMRISQGGVFVNQQNEIEVNFSFSNDAIGATITIRTDEFDIKIVNTEQNKIAK